MADHRLVNMADLPQANTEGPLRVNTADLLQVSMAVHHRVNMEDRLSKAAILVQGTDGKLS
jgi:hypothetical protein